MEISYIILGWLFGILSNPIISRIEKNYKHKDIKATIFSELNNLGIRLIGVYFTIQRYLGKFDKETLKWMKNQYEKYESDYPKEFYEAIDKLLTKEDDDLKECSDLLRMTKMSDINLKKYSIPFVESIIYDLSVFKPRFQMDILELKQQIDILNEDIENSRFHFRLTFDISCMTVNENIIRLNITQSYDNIAKRCKIILDRIDKILKY